jgi:protein-tyrosine phosphatase
MRALLRTLWPFRRAGGQVVACRVLFVCLGNLCRSPTAEAVFRTHLARSDLGGAVLCQSAGTHQFNLGAAPDGRARSAAQRRGYDMSKLRRRRFREEDFTRFDLILVMDRQNLEALQERCPAPYADRVRLLMEFARRHAASEVPDPYYSTAQGFEVVLDLIEDACEGLLEHVRMHYVDAAAPSEPAVQANQGASAPS